MTRKDEKEEGDDGLVGRILLVVSPIFIIALVVVIVCSLIATIIRVQKTNGEMPFTYANVLPKAVRCKHTEGKPDCKMGAITDEKSKFTILGWKRDSEGAFPLQKSLTGTFSFLDTMLLMLIKTIGNGLFDPNAPKNLDIIFNVDGQPKTLGVGNSIVVVLKLAAIFFAFMFLLPIGTPFAGIGGAILGVYLNSTILGYIVGIVIAILNIVLMGAWVPGFTALRLLGYGAKDSGVKFGTIVKNFLKHYGWLIAFILIATEVTLAISLLGGKSPPIIAGATASGLALLFFMIKDKKMFYKTKE